MIKQLIKDLTYPLLKSRPDFLIIGAQKAGTTSLYHYLAQHPQILGVVSWKEVRYFDRPEHYNLGFNWYLEHFPSKIRKGNKLTFEASPNYIYYEFVAERIKKDLGILKMIAILREPVSRAYSGWQMFHSFENIDNAHLKPFFDKRTFSEAVEEEFQPDFDYNKYPFRYDYVGRGRYVEQLENYCHHFGRENLLVLNFKDIHKNIPLILDEVCKFLNLNSFPEEIIQKIQTEKYNSGKYKSEKTREDEQTIESLKQYFVPYNEKLYDFLGYPYNW